MTPQPIPRRRQHPQLSRRGVFAGPRTNPLVAVGLVVVLSLLVGGTAFVPALSSPCKQTQPSAAGVPANRCGIRSIQYWGPPHHGARDTSTRHGTSKKMVSSTALSLWPIPHGIARNRRNNYFAVEQQPQPPRHGTTGGGRSSSTARGYYGRHIVERLSSIVSSPRYSVKVVASTSPSPAEVRCARDRRRVSFVTLLRVVVPSLVAGVLAYLVFPALALALASSFRDPGVFTVLSQDSSQFVQNFLTVAGLLFSILVGQTYYFLYTQQESIYYALFQEVTEAKSLLEQVALVCQGRSMYPRCLESISRYVQNDLKQIQSDPAVLLSARPVDDPLESIMYLTSVGVPSTVYDTVRSLREARAQRLGALQRKLPSIHFVLLWILAAIELVSFPLLGAGTQTLGGYNLLSVEGCLFGVMTGGIVMTLRVVGELWRPAGGAYNVDAVLSVMVSGLEEELKARMAGRQMDNSKSPSGARENKRSPLLRLEPLQESLNPVSPTARSSGVVSSSSLSSFPTAEEIQQQGADPVVAVLRIYRWIRLQWTKVSNSKSNNKSNSISDGR